MKRNEERKERLLNEMEIRAYKLKQHENAINENLN